MTDESAARAAEKAALFRPENEREDARRELLSPTGKYRLVVSSFSTGPYEVRFFDFSDLMSGWPEIEASGW